MPLLIAWRNVLKNKRRTVVTLLLSIVAVVFLIFYTSVFNGMFDKALKDSIEVYQGYMQIKGDGYKDKPTFENLLRDTASIEKEILKIEGVKDYTTRFETFVLLASEKLSLGAFFVGVNPEKEKTHSKFAGSVIKGRWLNKNDANAVVIGKGLAKKLNLKVGDRVSYVSNAIDYSFTADNLTVVGIFYTHYADLDKRFAIVNKPYMDENFLTKDVATTIVILPENVDNVAQIAEKFNKAIAKIDIETWEAFVETMTDLIAIKKQSGYSMFGVLYLIIFVVFLVYSMIAILARSKEIGIMRAIGTTPQNIIKIFTYETLIIAGVGIIIGATLGGWLIYNFEVNPILLTGEMGAMYAEYEDMGITLEPKIFTVFDWPYIVWPSIAIIIMNLLSIVYPVIKVLRQKPIDEIHAI